VNGEPGDRAMRCSFPLTTRWVSVPHVVVYRSERVYYHDSKQFTSRWQKYASSFSPPRQDTPIARGRSHELTARQMYDELGMIYTESAVCDTL
jgi:hypothetical protein